MFKSEEEMINHLITKYDKKFVFKEIGSGYGIADVVIVSNKKEFKNFSQQRENKFLISNEQIKLFIYMRNKRRGMTFDEIHANHFFSKRFLKHNILNYLVSINALFFTAGLYYKNPKFKLFAIDCVAIEGKLSDWHGGLVQAIRYKKFAKRSYVAIDESFIHRPKIEIFKEQNIGLISVGAKIKVVYSPYDEQPIDPTMRYRISENLLKINENLNSRAF